MGLGNVFLRDLMELNGRGLIGRGRRVLEIGAQQLADTLIISPDLEAAFRLFQCDSNLVLQPVGAENFTDQAPASKPFWLHLGMEYAAIDIDGDAMRFDLNRDTVADDLRGGFDLIVNAGTTEHVANQENAFRAIHDFTRVGGIMYHEVPAGGLVDHGFFSYQPKFFARLASQNDYAVVLFKYCAWASSPVPQYIQSFNERFGVGVVGDIPDLSLRVGLQKRHDLPFSCPIDAAPQLIPKSPARQRWHTHAVSRLLSGTLARRARKASRRARSSD
jgi:SAM-dependent methyltransferase